MWRFDAVKWPRVSVRVPVVKESYCSLACMGNKAPRRVVDAGAAVPADPPKSPQLTVVSQKMGVDTSASHSSAAHEGRENRPPVTPSSPPPASRDGFGTEEKQASPIRSKRFVDGGSEQRGARSDVDERRDTRVSGREGVLAVSVGFGAQRWAPCAPAMPARGHANGASIL
jgi:hypothetical protein